MAKGDIRGDTTMLKFLPLSKKYLLIVALSISSCLINGCVDSLNYLASDSRLPKWFTLPPGLTRADVMVVRQSMQPTRRGVDIKVVLYEKKEYKKLADVRGKTILSGKFVINVVNGVPEVTGYKTQTDEHGDLLPYFYVVDDLAVKRKLLDENETKLLHDDQIDYPALRKELLTESGGPSSHI
jgi:hypothetical protein